MLCFISGNVFMGNNEANYDKDLEVVIKLFLDDNQCMVDGENYKWFKINSTIYVVEVVHASLFVYVRVYFILVPITND